MRRAASSHPAAGRPAFERPAAGRLDPPWRRWVASVGGIGYIKGGGTLAALVTCLGLYAAQPPPWVVVVAVLALTALGVWLGNVLEASWGKDSSKIVLDEVVGMLVTMCGHPLGWRPLLAGFIAFRFFDIAKPLGIRKTERLPGGWGVMVDDIVAGIYASIVVWLLFLKRT
jgi:phosphatidylglycerophosphatase A